MGIQTHGRMRMLWRALIRTASANQPCSHTPQISIASLGFSTLAADSSAPPDSASGNLCTLRSDPKVVFVLGGPGSGKGTQCAKLAEAVGFDHLSAGDLLRAEILSDTLQGRAFKGIIAEGRIVPSEVTVNLLHRRMQETRGGRFLIDGFPRNEENRIVYEKIIGIDPLFVLFFDCSLEEMEARLLSRNQGRIDDNLETIRKRFKVFEEESLPVVEYYRSLGKVVTVNAGRTQQAIFRSILPLFSRIDHGVSAASRV